jgi:hypothetical protein
LQTRLCHFDRSYILSSIRQLKFPRVYDPQSVVTGAVLEAVAALWLCTRIPSVKVGERRRCDSLGDQVQYLPIGDSGNRRIHMGYADVDPAVHEGDLGMLDGTWD